MLRVAGIAEWDYVLRALWTHKNTPIRKSLKYISAGAKNMVNYLDDSNAYILEKPPKEMKLAEWEILMQAFIDWPFHPTVSGPIQEYESELLNFA